MTLAPLEVNTLAKSWHGP